MSINECTPENLRNNEALWMTHLENEEFWNRIPLLNVHEVHNFKESSLVRFRGMVQDMHSPEYYLEKYEVLNKSTNEKAWKYGKYVDAVVGNVNEEICYNCPDNITGDRQTYVIISTPALNKWVEVYEEETHKRDVKVECEPVQNLKRPLDGQEMETESVEQSNQVKKQCTEENQGKSSDSKNSVVSKEHILNFPLPERSGKKCHLKLYNENDVLKLNDTIEFVGFLSTDTFFDNYTDEENSENRMEIETNHPPSSLVPRIHCIKFKKIMHNNPLVTNQFIATDRMQFLKKELIIVLTQLLLGDDLAAEYLVCNLISEVYVRRDLMTLGKFCLNISNIPVFEQIDYTKTLYEFIEMLVPKSHYLPMTLENMNDLSFTPKKDYECNRLTSGILQLSSNTHLVLDETKLSTGQLNPAGVNNLKALASTIKNQKLAYDFNYYPIEYDCDISFLILSEGKSMLTPDCHVVLKPEESCVDTLEEIIQAAKHFLKPELLNDIRIYLTLARMIKYEVCDNMEALVQQEFVNMRQNESKVSADDLHDLLVLARLVCISEGKNTLDEACWRRACQMEQQRKSRIPSGK